MLLDSDAADGLDVMGLRGTGMFSTFSYRTYRFPVSSCVVVAEVRRHPKLPMRSGLVLIAAFQQACTHHMCRFAEAVSIVLHEEVKE